LRNLEKREKRYSRRSRKRTLRLVAKEKGHLAEDREV